jgi:hypothetical protein
VRNIRASSGSPSVADAPWFDLAFDVTDAREISTPARLRIEALADAGNEIAGFGVEYDRSGWQRDQVSADIWFDYGRGAIFSLGAESDAFACFLAREIGEGGDGRFVARIETDVVLINSDPEAMLTAPCRSKFFLGEDDQSEAQVFVNFDLPSRLVEFREKDLDYRTNLLRELVIH